MRALALFLASTALGVPWLAGCLQHGVPAVPTQGPEADCAASCRQRAPACSDAACARGCRLVMDRLVEHEGGPVLACVARASAKSCDDTTFAECAARVGPTADGGPPAPAPPSQDGDDSE